MGIPSGAVRQALQKEGKDPNIVDMDPEKSYASQVKKKDEVKEEKKDSTEGPALKDDPEYTKFFKMLKVSRYHLLPFHSIHIMHLPFTTLNYCRWAYRLVQFRTL